MIKNIIIIIMFATSIFSLPIASAIARPPAIDMH